MDWIGLIVFVVYMAALCIAIFGFVNLKVKYNKLSKDYKKSEFEKRAITEKFLEVIEKQNADDIEKTDGFLRFVSESRDWAFQYIEDVQKAIEALYKAESVKEKREANKKLLSFLPEQNTSPEQD